jgi:hypothetical protein
MSGSLDDPWKGAFLIGGVLAVIETWILFSKGIRVNRLTLGANLFLTTGALAFLLHLSWILYLYGQLMESTLFAWVIFVGVATTLFSSRGFLGVSHPDPRMVRLYSSFFLGVAVMAFFMSLLFHGNFILGGAIPFLALAISGRMITTQLTRSKAVRSF